ncbi:hypothetical protein TWF970_010072, partial [Orbilia oligospora]
MFLHDPDIAIVDQSYVDARFASYFYLQSERSEQYFSVLVDVQILERESLRVMSWPDGTLIRLNAIQTNYGVTPVPGFLGK